MFETVRNARFLRLKTEEKIKSSSIIFQRSLVRLSLVGLLAFSLAACQEDVVAESTVRPVKAVVVAQQSGEKIKSYSGDIRAETESALGFRITGKIVERPVQVGDRVSVGQVIARLDDADLILSRNSARAAVRSARTRLAVASDSLERATKLQPKGYAPNALVDQRRLEFDAAKAALEAAQAEARQAENAASYALLKADEDGVVTAVHAESGQVIAAGAPVASVAETGEMEIALSVPEQDVTQLAIGQQAALTLWADDDVRAKGRISEIAARADPGSRTYAIRIQINDPPAAMRLGMTATAELKLSSGKPYLALPLPSLTEIDGRNAVFVADRATQKVTPRFVEIDGVGETSVKIVSGLEAGDVVVTGGVQFLRDGMQVRLPDHVTRTASATQPRP